MLGQGGEPLLRPDDVGDPHQVVVHDVCEVVGGEAVALQEDLVVDLGVVEAHLAAQEVPHDGLAQAAGHGEPDDVRLARRPAPFGLVPRQRPAVAVVAEVRLPRLLLLPQRLEPLAGAEAGIGGPAPDELLRVLAVDRRALALPVGTVRPADVGALVPAQAQPVQGLEDHGLARGGAALAVGVLDPQDELPAVLAREGVVEEGDVGRPHVGVTGGAGGDARADRHGNRRGYHKGPGGVPRAAQCATFTLGRSTNRVPSQRRTGNMSRSSVGPKR